MEYHKKSVHITIDDGPSRNSTEPIVKILKAHSAKATFFLLGHQIKQYPEKKRLLDEYQLANHGYYHLNNWGLSFKKQCENILRVEREFPDLEKHYRPPYGKITLSQIICCWGKRKIHLWTKMTYDFMVTKTQRRLWFKLKKALKKDKCVLVFHDNEKSEKHTRWLLNRTLLELEQLSKETAVY